MDEELRQLLRQIIDLQNEQVDMMRNHLMPLWTRIRFSMMALLILMTVMAMSLGIIALVSRRPDYSETTPPVMGPPIEETVDDLFGPPAGE